MKIITSKIVVLLILGAICYGLFFLLVGAYYSHPNAEDLALAGNVRDMGLFKSTTFLLSSYDGRYFANILHGLNPLAFGNVMGYKYAILFSILFSWFSLITFFKALFHSTPFKSILIFSGLILVCNFALSASLVHELYWLMSSYIYLYSWCFWLLWVATFVFYLREGTGSKKSALFILSNVLMFLAFGINEMFLILNAASVLFLVYYAKKQHETSYSESFPLLLNMALSIFFFVSSPGILERFSSLNPNGVELSLMPLVGKSLADYFSHATHLLWSSFLILPVLILSSTGLFQLKYPKLKPKILLLMLLGSLALVFFMTTPYYLTMGHSETNFPKRIFTSIGTGLILIYLVLLPMALPEGLRSSLEKNKNMLQVFGAIAFSLGLYLGSNGINSLRSDWTSKRLINYSEAMELRYSMLEEKSSSNKCWTKVSLAALVDAPESVFHDPDIQANRETEIWNLVYESYFRVDEVNLSQDTISKKQILVDIAAGNEVY